MTKDEATYMRKVTRYAQHLVRIRRAHRHAGLRGAEDGATPPATFTRKDELNALSWLDAVVGPLKTDPDD